MHAWSMLANVMLRRKKGEMIGARLDIKALLTGTGYI